jgi:2-amino-4-hydroxy-6-hydroxymethyldihydropteridine diphosphokinase
VILALSGLYETPPWGFESDNNFLNVALGMDTSLSPVELLYLTKQIEREMGRMPKSSDAYQDRLIDIDILLYENLILHTQELTLPHPLMHKRSFVLAPLASIAPDLVHPVLKQTIAGLALILS